MTTITQAERMRFAKAIMAADEEPIVLLYALDLLLFRGETLEFGATVDRRARHLLVDVVTGVSSDE